MITVPSDVLASKMQEMTEGNVAPNNERNPVGGFIKDTAAKGINLSNDISQSGSETAHKGGMLNYVIGMVETLGGAFLKAMSSLMGMAPTGVAKGAEMVSSLFNGVMGKKSEPEVALASATTVVAQRQPQQSMEQPPTPGNIPNVSPLQERGINN